MIFEASVVAVAVRWGDIPTWVTAGVTLGAFIFAVVAVVVARRTFQLESERDRMNMEARRQQDAFVRRSQAALVSAWWAGGDEAPAGGKGPVSWGAFLRNASDTPVYKANMTIMGLGSRARRKAIEFSVVPPMRQPAFYPVTMPGAPRAPRGRDDGALVSDHRVSLRFTDSAGVRWVRDEFGALKELEPNLMIWTSPEGAAVVAPFTAEFLAAYGVRATFDTALIEAELHQHFMDTQPGPDILIGPHDWVGSLVDHGLVEQITLSDQRRGLFAPEYLAALSVEDQLYAVPSSLDTVALIRNTDLVPDVPETMEELIAIGQDLRDRGVVAEIIAIPVDARGDPFHIWPVVASAGGWLLGRGADGTPDPGRIGLDTAETIAAFEKIRWLGELGVLRPEIGRLESFEIFGNRRTAFILAASGAVVAARKAGVNFAVSGVPPFRDGRPSTSFLTVNGFYVARNGRNLVVASDLVPDYLTRPDVIEAFGRLAHVVPLRLSDGCDPAIATFHALCPGALPLPSFPQMREVWSLLGTAELALIAGGEAEEIARPLARRVRELFPAR